jgi:hypothetical protein
MPDVTVILLMIATLWWGTFCTMYTLKRMHQGCDEIATGVANGLTVSLRYRWLLLLQDYVGMAFGLVFVLFAVGAGFLAAHGAADDPRVGNLALFCAFISGWAAVAILVFVLAWVIHLSSLLRQARSDIS